jgi:PAS domain S-box-containing protein
MIFGCNGCTIKFTKRIGVSRVTKDAQTDQGVTPAKKKAASLSSRANSPKAAKSKEVFDEALFLRSFFDEHSAVMLLIDPETGRIVRANHAAEAFYGYSAEQFSGLTIYKINLLGGVEIEQVLRDALARKQNIFFFRHVLSNGEIHSVEVHSSPVEYGGKTHLLSIITDISGRIQAEQSLHRSEAEYRDLFNRIPDGVYRSNPEGRLLSVNPALMRMLGYDSAEELLQVDIARDLYVNGDDRLDFMRELDHHSNVRNMPISLRRRDGNKIRVLDNSHAIRNEKGEVLYYEGSLTDVTELHQAEDALARHATELELLYENSITTSMTLEPREIARELIGLMDKKMHWHHAAIRQFNRGMNHLDLLALNIPDKDEAYIRREETRLNEMISRPGEGLSGWVIQNGETVRSGSVQNDPRYVNTYPGLQSGLYVPMKVGERVIGSIAVESELPYAFDESDERLLVTLAAQAGVAIDNARLFQELQERAGEFEVLYETTRDLMNFKDFRALLNAVSIRAANLLNVSGASVYLYDAQSRELELVSLPTDGIKLGAKLKLGEGIAGRVAQTHQPLTISDYSQWEGRSLQFDGTPYRAVLGVPMIYSSELIGVLNVYDLVDENKPLLSPHVFDDTDTRLVSLFASAVAGAVYGTRLFEQVNRRAEELGTLARVSSALRSASTRVQMLPVILDQLLDILPADGASLAFVRPSNGDLLIELGRGSLFGVTAYVLPGGQGIDGDIIASRQPYFTANLQEDGRLLPLDGIENARAAGAVPLIVQERVMGILWVVRDVRPDGSLPAPFSESQKRLLSAVADMAANAMHRASLHEQTALHAEQMTGVSHLGRLLAETNNLETLYSRLAEGIYTILPDICGLFISIFEVEHQVIRCVYGHFDGAPLETSSLQPIPFAPAGGGKQSRVIDTHQPLIVDEIEKPTGPIAQFVGKPNKAARSALYAPMLTDGRVVGLIQVQSYTPTRFGTNDLELLTLVANTAAVEIENARLIARFERHVQRLTALHAIDTAINSSTDMRLSLRVVLEQATHLLDVDAASVLLLNPITLGLDFVVGSGFRLSKSAHASIRIGEGLAGKAAIQRTLIQSIDTEDIARCFTPGQFEQERFQSYTALPLIAKGRISGVLQLFSRTSSLADKEWLDFLYVLGDQVSLAVNNGNLFEGLERANIELTMAYDATIEGWSRALDLRDHETEGHTQRVTELTVALAKVMNLPEQTIPHIRRGALLHDIGKMAVPDEILRKPGALTEEEWVIMRQHPRQAYDLLVPIVYLRPALDIPYGHHEKWDGSGYPQGLKGEMIPLMARLFAIVDVYDALSSDRPYRPAWPREKTLAFLQEQSGKHFDPQVVEVFIRFIKEQPTSYK